MRGFRFAATAVVIVMCWNSAIRAQSRIGWTEDLGVARQMARQQQRLLLIHFWSNSCPPCLRLERYVFNQPEVIRAIHANYVPVKINATENPQIASQFRVNRWPTDIIATVDGKEVYRGVSQQDPNRYIAVLDQVAANTRVGFPVNGPASTAVAKTLPGGMIPGRSSYPLQNQLAGGPVDQRANPADRGASTARRATPPPSAPPQYTTNRYVTSRSPAAPTDTPARSAPMAPAYGERFAPPPAFGPNTAIAGGASRQTAAVAQAPARPSVPNTAPRAGTVAPDRNENAAAKGADVAGNSAPPQAAPGSPPIGLEGYCPVTLVEQQKWVKGDPRWGAIHEGRTYLFAGPEQQKRFLAEFDKYAPVLSGYDPVQFVETGKLVDGKRAHGVFYRDQIYLFVDEASLQKFWSAPERYVLAVLAARQQRAGQGNQRR